MTIASGIRSGLRSGIRSGLNPSDGVLVVIAGQSNAQGTGLAADLTGDNATYADSYPAVRLVSKQDGNTDPPVYEEYAEGDLRPLDFQGTSKFGVELSLARDLDAVLPGRIRVAKFALGSTTLASNWDPDGTYPTLDPPNLYTQFVDYVEAARVSFGVSKAKVIVVWIQGENDANNSTTASDYGTNLQALIERFRADFGADVPWIVGRLNAAYGGGAFGADVRTGEAAAVAALADAYLVDQDSVSLGGDSVHYAAAGYLALGHLYAVPIASILGVNLKPRPSFTAATAALDVTFTDTSVDDDGSIAAWSWDFGDGGSSTLQNPSHTYAGAGTYTVTLTVTDNDGATATYSDTVTVSATAWTVDAVSNKAAPADATEWTAFLASDASLVNWSNPTSVNDCQDATTPLADSVGAIDLGALGSGQAYQEDVADWDRKAATLTEGTTGSWNSTNASLPDISATSTLLLAYLKIPASGPAATRFLMVAGTTVAASARLNATGVISATSGGNAATGTTNELGNAIPVVLKVDHTGTVVRVYTANDKLAPAFAATMTGKSVRLGSTSSAAGAGYLYSARWDGAAAERSDADVKSLLEVAGWTVGWV